MRKILYTTFGDEFLRGNIIGLFILVFSSYMFIGCYFYHFLKLYTSDTDLLTVSAFIKLISMARNQTWLEITGKFNALVVCERVLW